jgi:large subunit ribosomal protein L4
MANLTVLNQQGEQLEKIEVSDAVFDVEVREHLFYEVIKWQLAKRRAGIAATKG